MIRWPSLSTSRKSGRSKAKRMKSRGASFRSDLAACSVRGAKVLAKMSSVHDPVAFAQHFQEIRKIEGEADEVTRSILQIGSGGLFGTRCQGSRKDEFSA